MDNITINVNIPTIPLLVVSPSVLPVVAAKQSSIQEKQYHIKFKNFKKSSTNISSLLYLLFL